MIPILCQKGAISSLDSVIGRLSDCVKCVVTKEINGAYELEMSYPIDGAFYDQIGLGSVIVVNSEPGETIAQLFDVYDITRPINGIIKLYAAHVSYRLNVIPVSPFSAADVVGALHGLSENAAEYCPFTFTTSRTTIAPYVQIRPENIRARLMGTEGSILDVYGGQLEFDNLTVRLENRIGSDNGVEIRYGKNLTSITQEESIQNTITGIYPFWERMVDGAIEYVELPEKVVHSSTYSEFPFARTIPLDFSMHFDEKPTIEELRAAAEDYILSADIGIPAVDLDVSFIDLSGVDSYDFSEIRERVRLGDTVRVIFEKLKVNSTSQITKTVYDSLKGRYESIRLGTLKNNLPSMLFDNVTYTGNRIGNSIKTYDDYLSQKAIFNKLTNNGAAQGLFLEDGNLYINATYIHAGILDADLVKVINLIADRVKSYSEDLREQTDIIGGNFRYLVSLDPSLGESSYKWAAGFHSYISSLNTIGAALNLREIKSNGDLEDEATFAPDYIWLGRRVVDNPRGRGTISIHTGDVRCGYLSAEEGIAIGNGLGPGNEDGTFKIFYFDSDGSTQVIDGLRPLAVNINGTSYIIIGKEA